MFNLFLEYLLILYKQSICNIWISYSAIDMRKTKSLLTENIKRLRKRKGFSQDQLARVVNITYNTLIKIESGQII